MRGILVEEEIKVFAEPSDQTLSITSLKKGDEFELGKVSRKKKEVWVEVTLSSGQTGFITGETKIFVIKKVQFFADNIESHEAPSQESAVIKTYPKKTVVTAVGYESDEGKGWVKIIDADGVTGYVKGEAKIRVYQEATKENGKKQMFSGGMFAVLAAAFYIFSYTKGQTTSNMSILIVAVFAFGLMQVVQGFLEYNKAKKKENETKQG
ncbi:SH3 domain-containing protein [bacterium]|nr:SH3 domain-containing protein [bacterium]